MKDIQKWKILKTDVAFDNEWCKVNKDIVELPSGKIIDDYFVHLRPEVVLTFPVTSDNKVIMVRQYKHGAKEILLEFPGGIFDPAEELPRDAALREMREETGYHSDDMEELTVVYDNPTKDTNRIFLFLARNAVKRFDTEFDTTEDIETVEVPLSEISTLIKERKIVVTGSIAIYYMALMALK